MRGAEEDSIVDLCVCSSPPHDGSFFSSLPEPFGVAVLCNVPFGCFGAFSFSIDCAIEC